jgi:hypothetical protein
MKDILKTHQFKLDYLGEYRKVELAKLTFYLKGKPDTESWRETFESDDIVPVSFNKRIFPKWALLDLYKLMEIEPGIEKKVLPPDLTLSQLPPLEDAISS